jgi:hypothetical protein
MTEFAAAALPRALSRRAVRPSDRTSSFGDLVHSRWEHAQDATDERARQRYVETRERFEGEHGKIVDDYWSKREPAGVALCCKRLRFGRLEWSLHRVMGSLAAGHSEYSPLLLRIARQSVRANSLLRGMTQRMATANLFSLSRDIMASLDTEGDNLSKVQEIEAYRRDLHYIAGYAGEAGKRAARVVYLKGLLWGVLALAALAPALAYVLSSVSVPDVDSTLFVGCLVAGSLGAVMSVLIRLGGDSLDVDHQFGREYLTSLAALRPLIGAVFAVLLYFAFKGNLVKQVDVSGSGAGEFAFLVTASFAVGFSERFAKQIVRTAEAGAGGSSALATPAAMVTPVTATPATAATT